MPPGIQRYKRTKMVLPLRVWPDDENGQNAGPQLAHTVDISPIGGRLGGLRNRLQTGQTIMLQRGQNKVRFRVIWTKQLGPGEIQAGIESMALEEKVWGVDLPDEPTSPITSHTQHNLAISTGQRMNPQMRWIGATASLLLAVSVAGFVGRWILTNSERVAAIPLPTSTPEIGRGPV